MKNLNDFDYELPEELIALKPKRPRSSSNLLVYQNKTITDSKFFNLVKFLSIKDRLIFNDTKVLKARLVGTRLRQAASETHKAKVEILLVNQISENVWSAFCRPLKKISIGDELVFSSSLTATVLTVATSLCTLQFSKVGFALQLEISEIGKLPIPPYIMKRRGYETSDNADYQTIFAKNLGAVAAPTASLHFDRTLMRQLKMFGIPVSFVTLHVGLGTFLPVKSEIISEHDMHSEKGIITKQVATEINQTKKNGGRIIAVGTTSLRLIESAALEDGTIREFEEFTDIFIKPGYKFKTVNGLITNFHLPKSTLLMLVSALVGPKEQKRIYEHAIQEKYRFYSYGDGSLLLP